MNNPFDQVYIDLSKEIMEKGNDRSDRTGTGTRSLFGKQLRFDLTQGFPLLTTKKVSIRLILEELFWFLRGETNIQSLVKNSVHIWNEWPYKAYLKKCGVPDGHKMFDTKSFEWENGLKGFIKNISEHDSFAKEFGELGPIYGSQWRKWKTEDGKVIDQIGNLVESLKNSPDSRSHIVNAWNPGEYEWLRKNSLPPCHVMFQCYVYKGKLSLALTQRSCDYFLGVPFNIASYSALTMMLAQVCGLLPGEFIWNGGDVHIYHNHFNQILEQQKRDFKNVPILKIDNSVKNIGDFNISHFELFDYDPHPAIKAPIAV